MYHYLSLDLWDCGVTIIEHTPPLELPILRGIKGGPKEVWGHIVCGVVIEDLPM
jgi:hypothetical protein